MRWMPKGNLHMMNERLATPSTNAGQCYEQRHSVAKQTANHEPHKALPLGGRYQASHGGAKRVREKDESTDREGRAHPWLRPPRPG